MKERKIMPNKALEDKRKYVIACYVGQSTGMLHQLLLKYWTAKVNQMSEGELMEVYYSFIGD